MSNKLVRALLVAAVAGALAVVASAATAGPVAAANPTVTGPISVPITSAQSGGVLNGVFTITSFALNSANQLVANGTFVGTVGGATDTVTSAASAPITNQAAAGGACKVLDLDVNPLHLDLLGLNVDLQAVHLDITAQQGPGNLLGNLLCALTGLLDNAGQGGSGSGLLTQLNRLLA